MRLQPQIQVDNPNSETKWIQSFFMAFRSLWIQLAQLTNGQIGFGDGTVSDNINGVWADALTVAGNFVVTHNLGRIPVGWTVWFKDGFEDIKFISSTSTQITLAGQNGGVNVKLFII